MNKTGHNEYNGQVLVGGLLSLPCLNPKEGIRHIGVFLFFMKRWRLKRNSCSSALTWLLSNLRPLRRADSLFPIYRVKKNPQTFTTISLSPFNHKLTITYPLPNICNTSMHGPDYITHFIVYDMNVSNCI